MKIGFTRIELTEGKVKYQDARMDALAEKDKPGKITPFYVELLKDEFVQTEAIIVPKEAILDLLILDMEKCEGRIERSDDTAEVRLMKKCIEQMERDIPLCDVAFTEEEQECLRPLSLISLKPVVQVEQTLEENDLIGQAIRKAGIIFFYTSGLKEVHAWPVERGSDILTCAGKIHTDLARGFIKGDVASFDDYLKCHNFSDGRKRGLVKTVDRGHVIEDGDVIEIRFNV